MSVTANESAQEEHNHVTLLKCILVIAYADKHRPTAKVKSQVQNYDERAWVKDSDTSCYAHIT